MEAQSITKLKPRTTTGAQVIPKGENAWRLEIPGGEKGHYRLAQLDDYGSLPRRGYRWNAPAHLSLRACASSAGIPGTWGFGLWNDPMTVAALSGAEMLRLPALPNAAWFFFASPPNYLSFRDDLPAQGALAATFRSPPLPALLLTLSAPALALFLVPRFARLGRRLAARLIRQDAVQLDLDPTIWHEYELNWQARRVIFTIDGRNVLETTTSPRGPLGLVIWVDNQFAHLTPEGRLGFGTLDNPRTSWIEIEDLSLN